MKTKLTLEQEKKHAREVLTDEIWDIYENLSKANLLIQGITQEYFQMYDPRKEKDMVFIRHYFENKSLYAEMLSDYLWKAKCIAGDLYNTSNIDKE